MCLLRCIFSPLFGLLNFLTSVTEGFSNTLIGDFEQFTRVQERADLDKKHKQGARRPGGNANYSSTAVRGDGGGGGGAAGGPGGGATSSPGLGPSATSGGGFASQGGNHSRAGGTGGFMGLSAPFFGGHERGGDGSPGYEAGNTPSWSRGGMAAGQGGTAGGGASGGDGGGRGYESGSLGPHRRGRREGVLAAGADAPSSTRRRSMDDSRENASNTAWKKDRRVKDSFGNKLATAFRKMSSTKQVTFAV